jgi:hypothetical protein
LRSAAFEAVVAVLIELIHQLHLFPHASESSGAKSAAAGTSRRTGWRRPVKVRTALALLILGPDGASEKAESER